MRDDAVLGRALPLDRGLGPETSVTPLVDKRTDKEIDIAVCLSGRGLITATKSVAAPERQDSQAISRSVRS